MNALRNSAKRKRRSATIVSGTNIPRTCISPPRYVSSAKSASATNSAYRGKKISPTKARVAVIKNGATRSKRTRRMSKEIRI